MLIIVHGLDKFMYPKHPNLFTTVDDIVNFIFDYEDGNLIPYIRGSFRDIKKDHYDIVPGQVT